MQWNILFFFNSVLLAMDAFSVSLANGLNEPHMSRRRMLGIAGVFAAFQALMPMTGWVCVHTIVQYFRAFEKLIPWIALALLGFIGGKMIWEAVHPEKEECEVNLPFSTILTQAIATSIDALAVGVSFALLEVNILSASVIIALTTLLCSLVGAYLGKAFGSLLKSKAEVFGGVILVLIGLKILLEHTILA